MRRFLLFTCLFPLALVAQAKSQQWYCNAGGAAAESMARSFEQSDFRPEHLNNPFQRSIAEHVVACSKSASRPGETLRDCVVRLCMGKTTALGRGSLQRVHLSPTGEFVPAGTPAHLKQDACYRKLSDHHGIGLARLMGMPKIELVISAVFSPKLPDDNERRLAALKLVDEAYEAEDVKAWFDRYMTACMESRS